jgi:hydroxyacyl-ACP dehydratase HTD2-like protein with hotdog domain
VGKKMEEIKMALIGKYVFENLITKEQKNQVITLANKRLQEGKVIPDEETINELNPRIRYLFFALAMAELGFSHGLKGFQWSYVRNPFMIETYDNQLWQSTIGMLKEKYGISVNL